MAETRTFYCLRCGHHFPLAYDPKVVVERTCPKCGSNSVRLAPAAPPPAPASKGPAQKAPAQKGPAQKAPAQKAPAQKGGAHG